MSHRELLGSAGRRFAKAQEKRDEARDAARVAVLAAVASGEVTETEAARLVGVDRMTVRKWLGKL